MRHKRRSEVCILRGGVILFSLCNFTCAFAAEQFRETAIPSPRAASGLHLEISGRHAEYHSLDEPYQFSPMNSIVPSTATGWERQWQEDRAWLRVTHDLRVSEHLLFLPGFLLGSATGWFEAAHAGLHFSEAWRTKPGLLWGLSLAGEFRADPARGPFLTVQCLFSRTDADEAHETVISNRPTNPDNRDARFRWQESAAILGLGCRCGKLKPTVGMAFTDFRLKKWLRYHIPETGVRDPDLQIVRALNSAESEYHYENRNSWVPFLELALQVTPTWALVALGTFSGSPAYSAGLRLDF